MARKYKKRTKWHKNYERKNGMPKLYKGSYREQKVAKPGAFVQGIEELSLSGFRYLWEKFIGLLRLCIRVAKKILRKLYRLLCCFLTSLFRKIENRKVARLKTEWEDISCKDLQFREIRLIQEILERKNIAYTKKHQIELPDSTTVNPLFYLPELDLSIEYYGGLDQKKYEEAASQKSRIYERHALPVAEFDSIRHASALEEHVLKCLSDRDFIVDYSFRRG